MTSLIRAALVSVVVLSAASARADYIDHFAAVDDIGIYKIPRTGTTHVLVIPVIIDNLPFEQAGGEQAFVDEVNAFYAQDATGWAFTPYYQTLSLGRYVPLATVADPVHFPACPKLGSFDDCNIPRGGGAGEGDLSGAATALGDAIRFLDQIITCATTGPGGSRTCTSGGGITMTDFDTSGPVAGTPDAVSDGVIVISNAGFPGIALPVKDLSQNPLLALFGPYPTLSYDGITVGAVAVAGREELPSRGTFVTAHEFGHLLGWCDLYNESATTSDMPYTLMGGWYYNTPGSLVDGYSRMAAGFADVVQVAKSGTYELTPSSTSGKILKVGTGDEFFTVELREKVQNVLDGDLQVPFGVIVERVRLNKRPSPNARNYLNTLQHCVNCDAFDTFLSIEQADGAFDLDDNRGRNDSQDLFQTGDSIAPSGDTDPRSTTHQVFSTNKLDGTPTGISITVTSATADKAVIDVVVPDVADACAEIVPYCGDLKCSDGECGAPPKPVVKPPKPPPSCGGCASSSASDAAFFALALFIARRRTVPDQSPAP